MRRKKILCKDGYDEVRRTYNEKNQVIRYEYFQNGELTIVPKGYSIMLREYDKDGFVAVESYYGTDEKPIESTSGYHKIVRTWAYADHPSSSAWFDVYDQPVTLGDTYVKREREYDESGNIIVERYYGSDGEKIPCKAGYDELHRTAEGEETYYLNGKEYHVPGEEEPEEETKEQDPAEIDNAA